MLFSTAGLRGTCSDTARENARLTGEDGSVLWNVSYSMQAPALAPLRKYGGSV